MSEGSIGLWKKISLGKLAKRLVNGGTPPTGVGRFWKGNIPWVTGADFTSSGIGEFRRFISEEAVMQSSTSVIDQGQLLIVTRTGVGKLAIAPCNIAISQDITGFYVDEDQAAPSFLYHRMRRGVEDLKKLNQGTSINGIVRTDLINYSVDLPPIPQQRRIAEILSTVDEAIEQTEALIHKYQQIKAGLMHDLFTRGVTPDGRLRPSQAQAPHLYKNSPLGWIPKEWEVIAAENLCSDVVDCPHSTPTYIPRGVPCIRTADMQPGVLLLEQAYCVDQAEYIERVARLVPREGDIIYSREGERLGIASPVGPEPVCLGQRVMLMRPASETNADFLLWAMNSPSFYRRIVAGLGATTSPHVNVGDIRKALLMQPSSAEQDLIGNFLARHSSLIRAEEALLAKLRQQKHGLIHDLLTGRVRVKVAESTNP